MVVVGTSPENSSRHRGARTVKANLGERFQKENPQVPHTLLKYNSKSPSMLLSLVTLLIPFGSYPPLYNQLLVTSILIPLYLLLIYTELDQTLLISGLLSVKC